MNAAFAFLLIVNALAVCALAYAVFHVGRFFRWWGVVLLLALPGLAHAQEAVPVLVDPAAVQALLDAAGAGKWVLALAVGISIVMGALKWVALVALKPESKVRQFVEGRLGGWLLNLGGSLAAAGISLAAGAAAGTPITAALVISTLLGAVTASLTGAGVYQLKKDVLGGPKPVASPAAAAAVLELPPKA